MKGSLNYLFKYLYILDQISVQISKACPYIAKQSPFNLVKIIIFINTVWPITYIKV